jgi:hypothetical protein
VRPPSGPGETRESAAEKLAVAVLGTLIAALLGWGAKRLYDARTLRRKHRKAWKDALAEYPLRPAAEMDAYSPRAGRVMTSEIARTAFKDPPYVPRTVDEVLTTALRESGFAVLVGPAKAGKSRTAWEAMRRLQHDVAAPLGPAGLAMLASAGFFERPLDRPVILYLDELENYLHTDPPALTVQQVTTWIRAGFQVMATIRTAEYALLRGTDRGAPGAREGAELLRVARCVDLDPQLNKDELGPAAETYGGILPNSSGHLAEELVAGPALLEELRREPYTRPAVHAVVRAAADWRRAGGLHGASREVLRALFDQYLRELAPAVEPADALFDAALNQAVEPPVALASVGYLLPRHENGTRSFEVMDYLFERAWPVGRPAEPAINLAMEKAAPQELLRLGVSAWTEWKDPDLAQRALKAARMDEKVRERASLYLALVLREQKADAEQSLEYLREAETSGNDVISAGASYWLGVQLRKSTPDAARAALERAIERGSGDTVLRAAYLLATLVEEEDPQLALELLGTARQSDNDGLATLAALRMGTLLDATEPDRAAEALRSAAESPDTEVATLAAYELGRLLRREDLDEAAAQYAQAFQEGTPLDAAIGHLAGLSLGYGSMRSDPALGDRAALFHGMALRMMQQDEAVEALQVAATSQDEEIANEARFDLGLALLKANPDKAHPLINGAFATMHQKADQAIADAWALQHISGEFKAASTLTKAVPRAALRAFGRFLGPRLRDGSIDLRVGRAVDLYGRESPLQYARRAIRAVASRLRKSRRMKVRGRAEFVRRQVDLRRDERAGMALAEVAALLQPMDPEASHAAALAALQEPWGLWQPLTLLRAGELLEYVDPEAAEQAYLTLARSGDTQATTGAFRLGRLAKGDAPASLAAELPANADGVLRRAFALGVALRGATFTHAALEHFRWERLAQSDPDAGEAHLRKALAAEDSTLRATAVLGVLLREREAEVAVELLREASASPEPGVADFAQQVLGDTGSPERGNHAAEH